MIKISAFFLLSALVLQTMCHPAPAPASVEIADVNKGNVEQVNAPAANAPTVSANEAAVSAAVAPAVIKPAILVPVGGKVKAADVDIDNVNQKNQPGHAGDKVEVSHAAPAHFNVAQLALAGPDYAPWNSEHSAHAGYEYKHLGHAAYAGLGPYGHPAYAGLGAYGHPAYAGLGPYGYPAYAGLGAYGHPAYAGLGPWGLGDDLSIDEALALEGASHYGKASKAVRVLSPTNKVVSIHGHTKVGNANKQAISEGENDSINENLDEKNAVGHHVLNKSKDFLAVNTSPHVVQAEVPVAAKEAY